MDIRHIRAKNAAKWREPCMTAAEATLTAENCPQMDVMTILTISQTADEIIKDITTEKMWESNERE